MRIAIITFHRAYNCGAMLQAWALKSCLQTMGHEVFFPGCNTVGQDKEWYVLNIPKDKKGISFVRSLVGRCFLDIKSRLRRNPYEKYYRRFLSEFLGEVNCSKGEIAKFFDVAIFGSDQIWNPDITAKDTDLFQGEVLPKSFPRIAYAASSGEKEFAFEEFSRLSRNISLFKHVSVREVALQQLLSGSKSKDVPIVADPVLLLGAKDFNLFLRDPIINEPYVYLYTVNGRDDELLLARRVAKKMNLRLVVSPVKLGARYFMPPEADPILSPSRMVNYIAKAQCVIAFSYHGMALATIFNKPFVAGSLLHGKTESRSVSLARILGLQNRIIESSSPIDCVAELLETALPDYVRTNLKEFSQRSQSWLENAIRSVSENKG